MKQYGFWILCSLIVSLSQAQLTDLTKKLVNNPGNLNAYLHLPANKLEGSKPLVVVLHGCNQQAEDIALGSGWNELADHFGFYVLYPEQRTSNNLFRCFNWFLNADSEKDKGEIASIRHMIQYAIDHYPIDTSQLYIYGVSAGAMMSVNYLAAYPQQMKSGAILAGGSYKQMDAPIKAFSEMKKPTDTTETVLRERLYSQNPNYEGKFPQLIVVHGTADKVVTFGNSELLIKQWKTTCSITKESDEIVHTGEKLPTVTKRIYWTETDEPAIIFYIAENWGHYLMIDPGPTPNQGGTVTKHALDGDFFSTYQILKDWNLVP